MRVKGAAEQRGAFAHPGDAVPATGGLVTGRLASQRRAARGRVGHGDLDSVRLEADGHLGAAPAVAYRVGQRLLQDAVRRPADAAGQPSALAAPAIHTPARIRAQNTNPGSVPRSWWPPTVSTATVAAMKAPAASSAAVRRTGRASPLWATATAYKATTGPNGTSTG